jgi:hypothetical protein
MAVFQAILKELLGERAGKRCNHFGNSFRHCFKQGRGDQTIAFEEPVRRHKAGECLISDKARIASFFRRA